MATRCSASTRSDLVVCDHEHHYERSTSAETLSARISMPVGPHSDLIDSTGEPYLVIGKAARRSRDQRAALPATSVSDNRRQGFDPAIGVNRPYSCSRMRPGSAFRDRDPTASWPSTSTQVNRRHYLDQGGVLRGDRSGGLTVIDQFTLTKPRGDSSRTGSPERVQCRFGLRRRRR